MSGCDELRKNQGTIPEKGRNLLKFENRHKLVSIQTKKSLHFPSVAEQNTDFSPAESRGIVHGSEGFSVKTRVERDTHPPISKGETASPKS